MPPRAVAASAAAAVASATVAAAAQQQPPACGGAQRAQQRVERLVAAVYQGASVPCDVDANVLAVRREAAAAASRGCHLVVFPELFLSGYAIGQAQLRACARTAEWVAAELGATARELGIAIAIMKDAEVILLDEPTSGLDPKSGAEFLQLLNELRAENKAIWMTTHDIFRAKEIADRVGIMVAGTLVQLLTREELQQQDLEALYVQYVSQATEEAA